MYTYNFTLTRVKDGDSLVGDIDLGMHTWIHNADIRLAGIDTPEIRAVRGNKQLKRYGLTVKQYLEELLVPGAIYPIKTQSDNRGKFGRVLAKIYHKGLSKQCLNDHLVSRHMALAYFGGSRAEIQQAHFENMRVFVKAGGVLVPLS